MPTLGVFGTRKDNGETELIAMPASDDAGTAQFHAEQLQTQYTNDPMSPYSQVDIVDLDAGRGGGTEG